MGIDRGHRGNEGGHPPDQVAHRLVTPLALVPHPQEPGILPLDIIVDAQVAFRSVLSIEASRVLLERPFP